MKTARTSSVPAETRTDHLRHRAWVVRDETPKGRQEAVGEGLSLAGHNKRALNYERSISQRALARLQEQWKSAPRTGQ
jgi:hypothetical protein